MLSRPQNIRAGRVDNLKIFLPNVFSEETGFLYPATKVWRGIMLYPSVSVRPSVRPSVLTISDR